MVRGGDAVRAPDALRRQLARHARSDGAPPRRRRDGRRRAARQGAARESTAGWCRRATPRRWPRRSAARSAIPRGSPHMGAAGRADRRTGVLMGRRGGRHGGAVPRVADRRIDPLAVRCPLSALAVALRCLRALPNRVAPNRDRESESDFVCVRRAIAVAYAHIIISARSATVTADANRTSPLPGDRRRGSDSGRQAGGL